MDNLTGSHIKGYQLLERIGAGGFGAVYKAHQSTVGREVAMKIILPHYANHPDFIRRFETEAQVIARLEHLHIVPLYDYWRDPDGAYLIMRWLKGGSLKDALSKGSYELEAVSMMLDQLASALSLAHRSNVIHRDLKPANIFLDEDGNAYLGDFGIAKDISMGKGITDVDVIVGSPDYLAPEQARSEQLTPRTDIYSLGVVLYELLTGEHPFPNQSTVHVLFKHLNEPLPEITTLPDDMAAKVNEIIQKATAKNPLHRYADALELASAFHDATRRSTTSQLRLVETLTRREQEILQLVIAGQSNKEIATQLFISMPTVKWYIRQIFAKLGVRSRVQAIVRARELQLITANGDTSAIPTIPTDEFFPENPYKGLLAFQSADSQDFFGREKLIEKLLRRMSETTENARFLAVVGPSGSGKSSLVKAGLIPAIWQGALPQSEKWFVVEMLPGTHPFDELEVVLTRIAANQSGNLREQLNRDERGLLRAAQVILPDDGSELLLVIDQFEELFTLVQDEAVQRQFLNLIQTTVTDPRSRVRIVATLRADYYDRPLHYPDFGDILRSRMETVLPLSVNELERAITLPAERVGVTFEPGLVASVIDEIHYQAGALPLLQYALTELFEQRRGRILTLEAYEAIGRSTGALAKRADELYLNLDDAGHEMIRQMFLRLVTLGEGAEDTRRRVLRSELLSIDAPPLHSSVRNEPALMERGLGGEVLDDIIDTYGEYRLLSFDHDPATREPTVEVAHEAILREWERLHQWLNESRDDIRQQRLVAQAAEAWYSNQRDNSYLLSGTRLEQVEKWSQLTELALTPLEREFMQASVAERIAQQQAEVARQAHEQRLEQRSRNFLRGLVAVFALATLISGGLLIFAVDRQRQTQVALTDAEESATYASSIALAAAASNAQSLKNPDQAITFAVAANTISENPPAYAQSILYDIAFKPATRHVFSDLEVPWDIRATPDGNRLVYYLPEFTGIGVLDLNSGETVAQWTPPIFEESESCIVNISADGAILYLSTSASNGDIIAFELMTGREIRRYAGLPEQEVVDCRYVFIPDGHSLTATTSSFRDDKWTFEAVVTWDIATGEIIRRFQPNMTGLDNLVDLGHYFSPDAQKLLIAYDSGQVVMWDVNTGERIGTYGDVRTGITAQSEVIPIYTPSGIAMIVNNFGTVSSVVTLWDEANGSLLHEASWESTWGGWQLSPDGQTLQIGLTSFQNILIDLPTWRILELYGNQGNARDAIFLPNGQLLSMANDGIMRLWNLENGGELRRFEGMTGFLSGMAISPDGRTLAAQQYLEGGEAPLNLWDVETGAMLRTLANNEASLRNLVYSPDGRFIFSASNHGNVYENPPCSTTNAELQLMDAATGELIWEGTREVGSVYLAATFTPDGTRILTGDWRCDNLITVWDAEAGAVLETWEGHQNPIGTIGVSPDGKWVASGSVEGVVFIWDATTGTVVHTLAHPEAWAIITTVFSPDSRTLLVTDDNSIIHLWDVTTGQEIRQLTGHTGFIVFVEFSWDGRYLISSGGGDGSIFVWDLTTGGIVRRINQPLISPIGSPVAFNLDGQSIFYADENHVIHQVDLMLDDGELLQWVMDNRYVDDLTCQERQLYRVEPLCESNTQ